MCPMYDYHAGEDEEDYYTAILLRKDVVEVEDVEITNYMNTKMGRNLLCVQVFDEISNIFSGILNLWKALG